MKDSIFQVIKQPSTTHYRWLRHPSRARLHSSHLISSTVHLVTHCSTTLDYIVYSLIGYMHNRALGKATNQRRTNDYFSPMKRAYFPTKLLLSTHFSFFRRIDHVC